MTGSMKGQPEILVTWLQCSMDGPVICSMKLQDVERSSASALRLTEVPWVSRSLSTEDGEGNISAIAMLWATGWQGEQLRFELL